jgi:hypothetical protein
MAINTDRTVCITFDVTTHYVLELEFDDIAHVMDVKKAKLAAIVDDGEGYEPSDIAVRRLSRRADVQSEDVTVVAILSEEAAVDGDLLT